MSNLMIFVDVEARGRSPVNGIMTEFGAVQGESRAAFHGRLYESTPDPEIPAIPVPGKRLATDREVAEKFTGWLNTVSKGRRITFVSDNPAYDFMWIAGMFDRADMDNPFGHSGRRLADFWAGLNNDWTQTQKWKRFRVTPHNHNPVNDAMGNVEAFARLLEIADEQRRRDGGYVPGRRVRINSPHLTRFEQVGTIAQSPDANGSLLVNFGDATGDHRFWLQEVVRV